MHLCSSFNHSHSEGEEKLHKQQGQLQLPDGPTKQERERVRREEEKTCLQVKVGDRVQVPTGRLKNVRPNDTDELKAAVCETLHVV